MSISNLYHFFLFLLVILVVYYLLPQGMLRQWLLILSGLHFYACSSPARFLLFVLVIAVNIALGQLQLGPLSRISGFLSVKLSLNKIVFGLKRSVNLKTFLLSRLR